MRSNDVFDPRLVLAMLAALTTFGMGAFDLLAEAPALSSHAAAQSLVESALRAELAGRNEGRTALLEQATRIAPEYAPARWHTGQLQIDGEWTTIDEVQRTAARDETLQEYRNRRAFTANEPGPQATLAKWCAVHGLQTESQVHWYNVLKLQPQNQQALQLLGLQKYRNEWLTSREIERRQAREEQRDRSKVKWRSTLVQWRRDITSSSDVRREAALHQLREVDDPAVIPSLEEQFSPHEEQLALEAVRVLTNIDEHEAVISLLRHAAYSQWESVRASAADALGKRSLNDYVPYLLDELEAPYEAGFRVNALPGGYQYQHVLAREGPFIKDVRVATQTLTRSYTRAIVSIRFGNSATTTPLRTNFSGVAQTANSRQASIATENLRINEQNQPYLAVLRRATSEDHGNDPRQWWSWWQQYNEIHVPDNKPTRVKFANSQLHLNYVYTTQMSCFLRGTKVWTNTGLTPIESIQLGDRVLAQDPETGELAFKPVLGTTLRPPAEMVDLQVSGESIKTTRGHPFWLNGEGWRMAKLLKAGGVLHGLHGAAPIEAVGEAPKAEAHNLVVADFHNYFVGETGLLVHDNTSRAPTTAIVPGLRGE